MPCRSDYLNPTEREKKLKETAQLCIFVAGELAIKLPTDISIQVHQTYADNVGQVEWLCEVLGNMGELDADRIIYDGKNKTSRRLADWWDEHREADERRRKDEERLKQTYIESARAKLTPAERRAVGLD